MLRRIIFVLFLIPLAVVLIALTVANRETVSLSVDVFNPQNPALSFEAPFFIWLYAAAAIGVIVGGIGTWLSQGTHRKRERQFKRESEKLRYEIRETERKAGGTPDTPGQSLALSR